MNESTLLYAGKAKNLHRTNHPDELIMHFRDDTSAFDGEKTARLAGKGETNNRINAFVMQQLMQAGIPVHLIERIDATRSLVKHLDMLPVECVVRNIATGSLVKRLGVEDGLVLAPPIFEFFLKDDARHDPMINDNHILAFGWGTQDEIDTMRRLTLEINGILSALFDAAGMILVDYKLEFGRDASGVLCLGDEFTPDGCRLWDKDTRSKLDKDRFRHGMGGVVEAYQEVAMRLGISLTD